MIFYQDEYPRTYRLALTVGMHPAGAKEITDEAFTRALERWDRIARLDAPAAWVRRVTINLAKRSWRQQRREQTAFARHGDTDTTVADDYLIELLDLMGQLSPRARAAIGLRYVLGMTEAEAAEVMGVSPGTVATTLHRARKKLASLLDDAPNTMLEELLGGEVA